MKFLYNIVLMSLLLISCKKTTTEGADCVPSEIVPATNFKLKFELTALAHGYLPNYTIYTNQNYPVEINKFKFYISDVSLSNSVDTAVVLPLVLVDFDDEFEFDVTVEQGVYTNLNLKFGIVDSLNTADPTLQPNDNPLGLYGSNGMHWSWLDGYRFLAIDGYCANSISEQIDIGVSLHTGTENLYQNKVLELNNFEVGSDSELVIQIRLDEIFSANAVDTLDVRTENQSHTFGPTAVKVTNRFLNSWRVKP